METPEPSLQRPAPGRVQTRPGPGLDLTWTKPQLMDVQTWSFLKFIITFLTRFFKRSILTFCIKKRKYFVFCASFNETEWICFVLKVNCYTFTEVPYCFVRVVAGEEIKVLEVNKGNVNQTESERERSVRIVQGKGH